MANVELATAYVTLIPSMQGAQGKIAEALMPAGAEGDKAGKNAGGMFAAGFGGVLGAAAVGVAAAGAAVGGAAVGLYKVGAVFDDVTDTIRVGTGASGDALDGLVAIAEQVGASVPTSFEKAGSTVSDLNTRLGLSGDTLNTVAQQYIQAGNILGTDVDITATSAAFSAFGIEGANVEGAMDSLFKVAQATGAGMNDLAATVQKNAVPMKNLGFSFEDTAALAGSLDKAGLNTSQTMGAMGKSLITLAKAGEEPEAAFKRTTGEIGDFIKKGDTAGALNLAGKVFGTKGATAFVGALQSGKIKLDDLTASAGLSSDTILGLGKETADAAESWQIIKNKALLALKPMGEAVFNLAGTVMGALADRMDGITDKISLFGIGVAGVVGILTTGDFKGPIFGMEEDSKFVDVIFNIRDGFLAAKETARAFFEGLTKGTAFVGPSVAGAFGGIGNALNTVFSSIGPVLGQLIPQLLEVWSAFSPLQLIFSAILPILPQIASLIGTLATSLGGALAGALTALMPSFLELSNMLSVTLSGIFIAVMPAVLQMVGMLAGLFTQLAPVIAQIVGVVAQLVTQLVAQLAPVFLNLITTVMPMIVTIFGAVVSAIVPLVTMLAGLLIPIIQALMPVVVTVFGVIANVIGSAMQIIMGIIQVVTGIITGNWSQVWDGIVNIVSGALSLVGNVLIGLKDIVFSALGGIGGWLVDSGRALIQGFIDGISGMVGAIGDAVGGVLGAVADFFPHSPAKKGPFSGRGYTTYSGAALAGDFADSIEGQRSRVAAAAASVTSAAVLSGSVVPGASAGGSASGDASGVVQMHVHPAPGMSEETIANVAANSLNYQLRMA